LKPGGRSVGSGAGGRWNQVKHFLVDIQKPFTGRIQFFLDVLNKVGVVEGRSGVPAVSKRMVFDVISVVTEFMVGVAEGR
jgi:hypothetical protein